MGVANWGIASLLTAVKAIRKFLSILGPGLITGASDDDPSTIATYAQTGAQFGYAQLWATLFTIPFMTVIQEICGRIGIVTGKGLAGIIREDYGRPLLYFSVLLLFVANVINIGADLGAMAEAARLVAPLPFIVLLLGGTVLILLLEIFTSYRTYASILKYLTLALAAYIVAAFFIKQDWGKIAYSTFVPTISFSKDYLTNIMAILGTTVSPYLFFWQTGEEVEEEVKKGQIRQMGAGNPRVSRSDVREMRLDTTVGMFFSNLVMWFVVITMASTLHAKGQLSVTTADQAALALKPVAGNFAFLLFALGIVGAGLLAVPVMAGSASYGISEAFGWREGLYRKFTQAHGFYAVIALATIVGVLVNFTPIKPFQMLYYAAMLNGMAAPPLMILIMVIGNNRKIMGKYTNSKLSNIVGWFITGVVTIATIALVAMLLFPRR
jgi:NRAMP (natural resistance-associated macrophage protein)-like metal ion transporter